MLSARVASVDVHVGGAATQVQPWPEEQHDQFTAASHSTLYHTAGLNPNWWHAGGMMGLIAALRHLFS